VPYLLAAFDVFILTSRRKGLPKAVMETMTVDLPIIATVLRGQRDLIDSGKNGCLVLLNDIEQTTIVMKRLVDAENFRRSTGEK